MDLAISNVITVDKVESKAGAQTHALQTNPANRRPAAVFGAELTIVAWSDPLVDQIGYDPRSGYVENFWLPILGPSSIWLLRRVGAILEMNPMGVSIPADFLASSLGLGDSKGPNSLLFKTVQRCMDFEVARQVANGNFAFRRRLAPLTTRQLARLPKALADSHPDLNCASQTESEMERGRAVRLAKTLLELGDTPSEIETQLRRWNFDPKIASSALANLAHGGNSTAR